MKSIAVCIPSFLEEENIAFVTKTVDAGLSEYYSGMNCFIVNADNNSTDKTKEIFLNTNTISKRIYLGTDKLGKGENIINFFHYVIEHNIDVAAMFDSDLKSIQPFWLSTFLMPIINDEFDFIFPSYQRDKYDGVVTSQVCFPLLYGLFGAFIRQPIAGDYAFSKKFIEYILSKEVSQNVREFGIDIYLTTEAILSNFKIGGVEVGYKIHKKRDRSTLGPMLINVLTTIFDQAIKNQLYLKKSPKILFPKIITGKKPDFYSVPPANINFEILNSHIENGVSMFIADYQKIFSAHIINLFDACTEKIYFNSKDWTLTVYECLKYYISNPQTSLDFMVPLFFIRIRSFIGETADLSYIETENNLLEQAINFHLLSSTCYG